MFFPAYALALGESKHSISSLLTSLISYWKLDESSTGVAPVTRNDSTASTNNLTDTNTTASAGGKISNAASFVLANSEKLGIASNASLQMGDIDFTIACWVNLTTKATLQGIIAKDDNVGAGREYHLEYDNASDRFRFFVRANQVTDSMLGSPSTGTWYFIVCWHDSTLNTVNIQINNGTRTAGAFVHDGVTGAAAFEMGVFNALFLDGLIDEAAAWKRLLTTGEKDALYNGGAGRTYPF